MEAITQTMHPEFTKLVRNDDENNSPDILAQIVDIQLRNISSTPCELRLRFKANPRARISEDMGTIDTGTTGVRARYSTHQATALIFACQQNGRSICLVTSWSPFLFVRVPVGIRVEFFTSVFSERLRHLFPSIGNLEIHCKRMHTFQGWESDEHNPVVRKAHAMLKVEFQSIASLRIANKILQQGLNLEEKYTYVDRNSCRRPLVTEESHISPMIKFTESCGLTIGGWFSIPRRALNTPVLKCSTCQDEFFVRQIRDLRNVEVPTMAPLLVASFDVEANTQTYDEKNEKLVKFPDPRSADNTIGVGVSLHVLGTSNVAKKHYYFALGDTDPSESCTIFTFQDETKLLLALRDFFVIQDPDIVMTYNGNKFDNMWLGVRWETLGNGSPVDKSRYFHQSRIWGEEHCLQSATFSSRAFGESSNWSIPTPGRLQLDLLVYLRRQPNFSFRSYRLSAIAQFFLRDDKHDITPLELFKFYRTSAHHRKLIAEYCIQDCDLVLRIADEISALVNIWGMAQVTMTLPHDIISGGQQKKIMNLVVLKCHENNFFINDVKHKELELKGATVLEPLAGFYTDAIATCDFRSLYPSIMIAWNLSHDTHVIDPSTIPSSMMTSTLVTGSERDYFIKPDVQEGLLTKILKELLNQRKRYKDLAKMETDPMKKRLLNALEKSYKITTNSIYGFTGATTGKLPNLHIARTVTARGRMMIQTTVDEIKTLQPQSQVIYGDTDSVMIQYMNVPMERAFELAHAACEHITAFFRRFTKGQEILVLEMEKITMPYWIPSKKRYAGLCYETIQSKPKLDIKGMVVRRDLLPFVQTLQRGMIEALLYTQDLVSTIDVLFDALGDLIAGKIPIKELSVACSMKDIDSYKSKVLPQVAVAMKMKQRNPGSEPRAGDIVTYVILDRGNARGTTISSRAEDLEFAIANGLKVDYNHVITTQVSSFVTTMFGTFTPCPERIVQPFLDIMESKKYKVSLLSTREIVTRRYPPVFTRYKTLDPQNKCKIYLPPLERPNVKKMKQTTLI